MKFFNDFRNLDPIEKVMTFTLSICGLTFFALMILIVKVILVGVAE